MGSKYCVPTVKYRDLYNITEDYTGPVWVNNPSYVSFDIVMTLYRQY